MTSRVTMNLVVDCDGYACEETLTTAVVEDTDVASLLKRLLSEEDGTEDPGAEGWLLSGMRDLCPACLARRNRVERAWPRCNGKRRIPVGDKHRRCPGCLDCQPLDKPRLKGRRGLEDTEPLLTPHLLPGDATEPLTKRTRRMPKLKERDRRARQSREDKKRRHRR